MMDSTVKSLLEQAIDTPCKLHLLLIFTNNPKQETTSRQLAERICRDIWSVSQALQELAEAGILMMAECAGGEHVYRYAPHSDKVEAIRKLVHGYDDPFQRDWIQSSVRELESYAAVTKRFAHQSFAF